VRWLRGLWRTVPAGLALAATLTGLQVAAQDHGGSANPAGGGVPPPRVPGSFSSKPSSLQGDVRDGAGRPLAGVAVRLSESGSQRVYTATTNGEGIFRIRNIVPGRYQLTAEKPQFQSYQSSPIDIDTAALFSTRLTLQPARAVELAIKGPAGVPGGMVPAAPEVTTTPYRGLPMGAQATLLKPEEVPAASANFSPEPYRWGVPMPEWDRYAVEREPPYINSHWYNPFNRNKIKGDYPIFGQRWFFNFTGTSETGVDVRRLPTPGGVSAAGPGESRFFGKQEQGLADQTFRFSFDLFRGDTSFRPVDFRVRFTPAVNVNFLQTRERGIVNIDVREGINRYDAHAGLQEGFIEAKLHDLSPNFDFVSVRAGIQQFNSDFRGFIFSEEQPGIRIFGNLRSNRINYNLAYFYMLEKDTNSELNTFQPRDQQVYVANVYVQDFLTKGYTTEFSFHYNRDDATIHFDENNFLVRPAPIGFVVNCAGFGCPINGIRTHNIRAYYLGWAGNGHLGRINVSHAFYQALGHDTFNTIAGRRVDINGRMGALELSLDKDWVRFRTSAFYQSGDDSKFAGAFRRDGTAHGFDTIVDDTHFAGTSFSFWNSEGIRLTSTGVALVNPGSLLASLRSNKFEGQANFVNPGLFLANFGMDFDVTPKLRAFVNSNYVRFMQTEPLEIVLFQRPIHHSVGEDFGMGFQYRPPLTENIILTAGVDTFVPGWGFEQIYTGKTLLSGFAKMILVF
jgi:hypothetical protein